MRHVHFRVGDRHPHMLGMPLIVFQILFFVELVSCGVYDCSHGLFAMEK